ncbi:MAG TPA: hypothetical protein DCY41_04260, partial [Opitutae bacterium]|nr:hypothetical protein [Opitutae bacterium]
EGKMERQYQVGLREVNGQSYQWVDESIIKSESTPPSVMALERMENGAAFVLPQELKMSNGQKITATDPLFVQTLQREVSAAAELREKIISIER